MNLQNCKSKRDAFTFRSRQNLTAVGFEATPSKWLVPKTSALDQSYYEDKLLSDNGLHVWSQVEHSAYVNAWEIGTWSPFLVYFRWIEMKKNIYHAIRNYGVVSVVENKFICENTLFVALLNLFSVQCCLLENRSFFSLPLWAEWAKNKHQMKTSWSFLLIFALSRCVCAVWKQAAQLVSLKSYTV